MKESWRMLALSTLLLAFSVIQGQGAGISYNSDYAAVKSQLTTPSAVAEYMTSYFTYDTNHYGYSPYAPDFFNARRLGDCKDYATFFADILSSHSYSVHKYVFRYNTQNNWSHVVCIFTDRNGLQYVASNKGSAQQIYGPISNLAEAGTLLLANGVLPQGSVTDRWLQYPANFTGQLLDSKGFSYDENYQTARAQLTGSFQYPAIYMTAFFSVENHSGANAYSPVDLNTRRGGDAKDFAVFNAQNAYATIRSFRYNKKNNAHHIISVTSYNNQFYFQSFQYFFGPVNSLEDIVSLLKANGHIPADSEVDDWQSYPYNYTGPFPVATNNSSLSAAMLLLQEKP